MKKMPMLWTGAGVIVVTVIVYAAFFSSSTNDADLQGAIGAAKQYRADQITDADVVLSDPEIQELLQSDFFYKLTTDDEFRKVAVDQLARLDMAGGRSANFTNTASLSDMKMFLDLALGNNELKQAMADGRMNIVSAILASENRLELLDVANRIYLTQGRSPQLNAAALSDMKMFLDNAMGNAQLRMALADGRMNIVNDILADGKQAELFAAAQKVFIAESRRPQLGNAALADMKVFLDFAMTNADLKAALADGKMNIVNAILLESNRTELVAVANRIYLTQGRSPQLNAAALEDMKMFMDVAVGNRDLKLALVDGRMELVNAILVADGRAALNDAAGKVYLADRRQPQFAAASLGDLKVFLDFALTNADLKAALADGKMNIVNAVLLENGKVEMIDVANRIYLTQGRSPQLNAAALGDMKMFLDLAFGSQDLKLALADGRIADVDAALVKDGRMEMCAAANRVYLAENRRPQLGNYANLASMRTIANFASENAEFRQALQDGRMDMAARMALAAGKYDISLRSLQMTNYVVGDHRNFVPDLNRLVTVADSPSFKLAAENQGWGRLVASADAASWKQTVDAVKDGKMAVHH